MAAPCCDRDITRQAELNGCAIVVAVGIGRCLIVKSSSFDRISSNPVVGNRRLCIDYLILSAWRRIAIQDPSERRQFRELEIAVDQVAATNAIPRDFERASR